MATSCQACLTPLLRVAPTCSCLPAGVDDRTPPPCGRCGFPDPGTNGCSMHGAHYARTPVRCQEGVYRTGVCPEGPLRGSVPGTDVRRATVVHEGRALSGRQQQVLDLIKTTVSQRGYPPSVREIGEALGLSSPSTVHSHLTALVAAGLVHAIRRNREPSRSSTSSLRRSRRVESASDRFLGLDGSPLGLRSWPRSPSRTSSHSPLT